MVDDLAMSWRPDINALVLQMRAVRTDESMMRLYKHVFQLGEWFVPVEPSAPEAPMQWTFPEGRNPTPCILVYTDAALAERRAMEVAASIGGTAGVMAMSVADAVHWMSSGKLGVTWACFNYSEGSENFPLYFGQAEKLAIELGVGGGFFPPEYKQFPFTEGDLLANRRSDGKFAVSKILKVDRWELEKGQSISIQGKTFVASEDDYLLIVSAAYGASEFESLDDARAAACDGRWTVQVGHAPNRTPGAAEGQTLVGHAVVTPGELEGYAMWRRAFENGEAGIF